MRWIKSPEDQWRSRLGVKPNRRPPERSSRWAPPPGHWRSKPYSTSTTPHCVVLVALVTVGRLGTETTEPKQEDSLGPAAAGSSAQAVVSRQIVSRQMDRTGRATAHEPAGLEDNAIERLLEPRAPRRETLRGNIDVVGVALSQSAPSSCFRRDLSP